MPTITTKRGGEGKVCLFILWRRRREGCLCGSLKSAASVFERLTVCLCACIQSLQTFAYIHWRCVQWEMSMCRNKHFFSFYFFSHYFRGALILDRDVQAQLSMTMFTSLLYKGKQKEEEEQCRGRGELRVVGRRKKQEAVLQLSRQSLKSVWCRCSPSPRQKLGRALTVINQAQSCHNYKWISPSNHFQSLFCAGTFFSAKEILWGV